MCLLLFIQACQAPISKENANDNYLSEIFSPPTIIDSLPKTKVLKKAFSVNISYPSIEAVAPFGNICDLNQIKYNLWDTSINRKGSQRADGLQLLVDTNQKVTLKSNKERDYYRLEDSTQVYYEGLPCFIYNETSQTKWLYIQDSRVIAIQEAFDSNYNWRPIQIWNWSWCGNSYERAYIKPKNYLLFKVPLYEGDYYTDLLIKVYSNDATYYSNEYKGWINYKQFDLPKQLMNKDGKPDFNLSFLTGN